VKHPAHRQLLLDMYEGSAQTSKVAMINTDYFCRDVVGCGESHIGAPEGLFIRNGTLYHPASSGRRAVLAFDATRKATIFRAPYQTSYPGIFNAIGGGPMILDNGTMECNPPIPGQPDQPVEGDDLIYRCIDSAAQNPLHYLQDRSGACISGDGYTLHLIATDDTNKTTWRNLADFMKSGLGCANGLQLDGGGSTSLVFGGVSKVSGESVGTGLLIGYVTTPSPPCNPGLCFTSER
jgi:hypothetical protein